MIVDVNVYLSRWPFRRLPFDETANLVKKLRENRVTQAWAGSFDGLLHQDIASVNFRLTKDCKQYGEGLLLPVGSVNPMLPDWQDDLRRCHEQHGMHAIRLHPNYHGYGVDAAVCDELLTLAEDHRMIVQMALRMEDERTQHPLVRIPSVDPRPLESLISRHPKVPVVVLNNRNAIRGGMAARLAAAGQVYFDISHAEQAGAMETIVKEIPHQRLLFGSHFPFFNLEASLLKFRESQLKDVLVAEILRNNAERLLQSARPDVFIER